MKEDQKNQALKAEAEAYDSRALEREANGFIPDLQKIKRNEYFYKSFWRDPVFADLYIGEMLRQYLKYIENFSNPSSRILDLGCGQGYFSLELARRGFKVVGVDISSQSIEIAKKTALSAKIDPELLRYEVMDVDAIDQLGCFDIVLCSGVLHHFEDIKQALSKIKMVLEKNNGILISHEPQHDYFKTRDASFVAAIRQLLAILGFWYEDKIAISDIETFESFSKDIHSEYVLERDASESAQSPNDLEHDRDDILPIVKNDFDILDIYQSSSFIYRLIGGLRHPEIKKEHELAKFLAIVDRALVNNGALAANYFYFCARVNSLEDPL